MNKLYRLLTAFLAVSLIVTSCDSGGDDDEDPTPDPPVAAFTASSTTVETGEVVTFNNASTDADSFAWTFGDGGTSTDQNPTHTYTTAGTYTVELTATNEGGSDVTSVTITVNEAIELTAGISVASTETEVGVTITFNNTSTGATGIAIDLGDGTSGTLNDPAAEQFTYTYLQTGTYTVTLTATDDDGGSETASVSVTVAEQAGGTIYLTSVSIDDFPLADENGDNFDADGGIDFGFAMGPAATGYSYQSAVLSIAGADEYPVEITEFAINANLTLNDYPLTNEPWWFDLYEDDGESAPWIYECYSTIDTSVPEVTSYINPRTDFPTGDETTGSFTVANNEWTDGTDLITYPANSVSITFNYEIRMP